MARLNCWVAGLYSVVVLVLLIDGILAFDIDSDGWSYNFAGIRQQCKYRAECPNNEMQRLFNRFSTAASQHQYFDDQIGEANIALEAILREFNDLYFAEGKELKRSPQVDDMPLYLKMATSNNELKTNKEYKQNEFILDHFDPLNFELAQWRTVNIRGISTLTEIVNTGTDKTGPWQLKMHMRIPEPGYVRKKTGRIGDTSTASKHSATKSTATQDQHPAITSTATTEFVPIKFKPNLGEKASSGQGSPKQHENTKHHPRNNQFWREKAMHYYAGLNLTVVLHFNRNYPFEAPKVTIHNNIEHSFLSGGQDNKSSKIVPSAFFTPREGYIMQQNLPGGGTSGARDNRDEKRHVLRRYFMADVLQQTLCFLTYSEEALLSLPFLTMERVKELQKSVKEYSSRAWWDKRLNLVAYPKVFMRNKMFFEAEKGYHPQIVLESMLRSYANVGGKNILPREILPPQVANYNEIPIERESSNKNSKNRLRSLNSLSIGKSIERKDWFAEQTDWLDPTFLEFYKKLKAIPESSQQRRYDLINKEFLRDTNCTNVFWFPFFSEGFCDLLVHEVRGVQQSGLEVQRPNSMNNYGVILNDVGLEPLMDSIQDLLRPLGEARFGAVGSNWDGHHSFIVQYEPHKDTHLDMHTDDSDVTVNFALGVGKFDGSEVRFCGKMGEEDHRKEKCKWEHKKGSAIIHLGRHRHGAMEIKKGERLNLIIWNRGSSYRDTFEYDFNIHKKEDGPPDKVCLSYTHDRDFGRYKDYPVGQEHFKGRKKWCPKPHAEYENFVADPVTEQPYYGYAKGRGRRR